MLTQDQKGQFHDDGYLLLKGVLSKAQIDEFRSIIDRMYEMHLRTHSVDALANTGDSTPNNHLHEYNIVTKHRAFIELIDLPATFPIILELMGPHIVLTQSQALVRANHPLDPGLLHRDGGKAMAGIRLHQRSKPLQIKIQYALTDVAEENCGNFVVEPGSHHRMGSVGLRQLCPDAGDTVIFHCALRHGYVKNESDSPRKTLVYGYAQQFMRPFDFESPCMLTTLLDRCTLRQRRLLGDVGTWRAGNYYYSPRDQDDLMLETITV